MALADNPDTTALAAVLRQALKEAHTAGQNSAWQHSSGRGHSPEDSYAYADRVVGKVAKDVAQVQDDWELRAQLASLCLAGNLRHIEHDAKLAAQRGLEVAEELIRQARAQKA